METQIFNLWENTPGKCEEVPTITYYKPVEKTYPGAVVILPGGGYTHRAPHEGGGYAEFLAAKGITAFVVEYRVNPHTFPIPLLDARRGIRFVRYYAEKFGIDKNKISVMGSSAGGHLASLVSTYYEPVAFEGLDDIDKEDFIPNSQILCYPVITLWDYNIAHIGSGDNLIGDSYCPYNDKLYLERRSLSSELNISEKTPPAFIWHTFEDGVVDVRNSLRYADKLREFAIPVEMHIFPHGRHGLGLTNKADKLEQHVSQWGELLVNWLEYMN